MGMLMGRHFRRHRNPKDEQPAVEPVAVSFKQEAPVDLVSPETPAAEEPVAEVEEEPKKKKRG